MKQIFTIIFVLITLFNYSQINWTYDKVQKKYGNENITESKTNNNHFEVKKLTENETIKFTYNVENIVKIIEVENRQSIDNDRFHKLAKELNSKFKVTSFGNTENSNLYYDSKNGLLTIKIYKTNAKKEMNKIVFISDPNEIAELIPDIKNWK